MKKTWIIFLLFYLVPLKALGFDITEDKRVLFVFKDKHTISIYNTSGKDSVVAKIHNDGEAGLLYGFEVIEKQDSMVKVIVWNTVNDKKFIGWVKITETDIIGHEKNHIYEPYERPDYNSKKTIVNSDWEKYTTRGGKYMKITANIDSHFQVFDISGKWLKVKVIGKDKVYLKWLPREYQCHDICGECN
jgi:hypothetical protein